MIFVNKESPTYIEHGKKCEFTVTTFDSTSSGLLENPVHSLPPNTTCHYHFHGHQNSIIWITFIKYHVRVDLHDLNPTNNDCNVQLQIWDGDIKNSKNNVQLIGQFCKDEKPKLCDHSLLTNSSRLTRPCGLAESYLSSKSDLTISHSIRYGSVLYPVNFVLKYEFVDLSQEGVQMTRNPCDRLMKPINGGRFYSPKITFLYGRGGQQDLKCTYQFESTENDKLKIVFNRAHFGNKQCTTIFNMETMRWQCNHHQINNFAQIQISEYPWPDIELKRDCLCTNLTKPFTIVTKTAKKVLVVFHITNMQIHEDYNDYYFDATYEYITNEQQNCLNPWNNRRLRGSSGEITIRNNAHEMNNQTIVYCLQQPWLIEPENDMNFIYLKIRGTNKRDTRLCPIKNRILIYPAGHTEDVHVICPYYETNDDFIEMFSEGWTYYIYRKMQTKYARSFIIEFIQKDVGNFMVTWMEVSKNPALLLPMVKSPECPHRYYSGFDVIKKLVFN